MLLALGGAYAAKLIHDAQLEVDNFRQKEAAAQSQVDALHVQLGKYQEILHRLQTDPDFLDRMARAHLDYARPDELIFRFNVDPVTGAASVSDVDGTRSALNAPLPPSRQSPAATNPATRHP